MAIFNCFLFVSFDNWCAVLDIRVNHLVAVTPGGEGSLLFLCVYFHKQVKLCAYFRRECLSCIDCRASFAKGCGAEDAKPENHNVQLNCLFTSVLSCITFLPKSKLEISRNCRLPNVSNCFPFLCPNFTPK